jgi:hypothetical protein
VIDKPLYQNPLGGGLGNMIVRPGGGNVPRGGFNNNSLANSAIGNGFYEFNKNLNEGRLIVDPNATAQKKADQEFLKTADEYQRGFRESEFYKPYGAMTADMAEFTYSSPTRGDITMKGSSSGIGQFGAYLDSIGKGDLLQRAGGSFSQETGPLATVGPNVGNEIVPYNPDAGQGVGLDGKPLLDGGPSLFPFPGMDSTEVASAETNPYNRVGQQLTGPNQDDILGTLKNIEQGIASLGQGSMNQSSFGGFNNNFGIGSFFPPYGGMYG